MTTEILSEEELWSIENTAIPNTEKKRLVSTIRHLQVEVKKRDEVIANLLIEEHQKYLEAALRTPMEAYHLGAYETLLSLQEKFKET